MFFEFKYVFIQMDSIYPFKVAKGINKSNVLRTQSFKPFLCHLFLKISYFLYKRIIKMLLQSFLKYLYQNLKERYMFV